MQVISRLKRLEQKKPECLTVLAKIGGIEKRCSVDEFVTYSNATFVRVLDGTNLHDVDRIIDYLEVTA